MIRQILLGTLVVASGSLWAQLPHAAVYPVSASEVAQALTRAGIHVSSSKIYLGVEGRASAPRPTLDVLDVEPSSGLNRIWVRIGCHERQQCRPFYARVSWSGPIPSFVTPMPANTRSHAGVYRPPVIRFGDHATLVVDNPRLHLEIAVVALQNGAVGQVIHLATPDRKLFYQGQVVNKSTLKGSL